MSFVQDLGNVSHTQNGAITFASSTDALVDMFFRIGALRNQPKSEVEGLFLNAHKENPELAWKMAFYVRDVRGGQGERSTFRNILNLAGDLYPEETKTMLPHVVHYGRWDDLLVLQNTEVWTNALKMWTKAIQDNDGLACKWAPRENKKTKALVQKFCRALNMTPRQYRKTIVAGTNVVEQNMCANKWTDIQYAHVPSKASMIYRNAFKRHDDVGYNTFLEDVSNGTKTIHSGTLYPHEIIRNYTNSSIFNLTALPFDKTLEEQWKALPNYLGESGRRILPVVDTSGSMYGTELFAPLYPSVALGIYLASRNQGSFHNAMISFSMNPKVVYLNEDDSLAESISNVVKSCEGYNTDLQKVFKLILDTALRNKTPSEEMPDQILLLSDMEFDIGLSSKTNHQQIEDQYKLAGYKMPEIVYWNLNAGSNNVPVKFNEEGVALVSGYSPSLMEYILNTDDFNPAGIMLNVLRSPRYEQVQL